MKEKSKFNIFFSRLDQKVLFSIHTFHSISDSYRCAEEAEEDEEFNRFCERAVFSRTYKFLQKKDPRQE